MKRISLIVFLATISVFYIGCEKDKEVEETQEVEESNVIPVANFSADIKSGRVPLTVSFTDKSENKPTEWLWTLGDNSTSIIQNPIRTYQNEGIYSVTLTVLNRAGSDTKTKTEYIKVTASNAPPEALFTVSPVSGHVRETFSFDASASTDDYDSTSNLQVRWDFDGDGNWDTEWDTNKVQNHQFSNSGFYKAKIELKDTEGLIALNSRDVIVDANEKPNALFDVTPSEGTVQTIYTFNASSCTDDFDPTSILQVRWDFDGDGNWDTDWDTNKVQNHQFSMPGSYITKIEVKDTDGLIAQNSRNIIVDANVQPTALFTVTPSEGTLQTVFTFNASSCNDDFDPTSSLQVRWDFEGDGNWDTDWSNNKVQNHQFSNSGTYTVKLEVKDTQGLTDQYTSSVMVAPGCEGETHLSYGGQTYEITEIGFQCWMAENLNYETEDSWWFDNSSTNGDTYGRLYTWEAALNACPNGWHLPSDEEWKTLEMELGMSQDEVNQEDWRGTNQGDQMKATSGWNNSGNGTNTSGFTALPGGYRLGGGSFHHLGNYGSWWSSSEGSTRAWYRGLYYDYDQVERDIATKAYGRSVRCLKD